MQTEQSQMVGWRQFRVVGFRARNGADQLAATDPAEQAVSHLLRKAEPVGPQCDAERWMVEDRRRPLDCVDFREQGGDDQTRSVEELLVVPRRVFTVKAVADRVVLEREQ